MFPQKLQLGRKYHTPCSNPLVKKEQDHKFRKVCQLQSFSSTLIPGRSWRGGGLRLSPKKTSWRYIPTIWDGDVYRNIPSSWRKKPSKSMQINETVRCCQDQLTPPKCWGKRQTRRTFFFPATRYMMSVRTKSFSPESTWIKNCRFLGFSQASAKIRKFLPRESLQKPLYYIHGFSKRRSKVSESVTKKENLQPRPWLKIRCMISVWIQIIHSKDPEIKLVAISRVASEPSWSGLGWPAGTDCTSTFSNSSKHTPCVNMDISSIRVYIV